MEGQREKGREGGREGVRRDLASGVAGASISAEAMTTCPGVRTTLPVTFHAFRQRRV